MRTVVITIISLCMTLVWFTLAAEVDYNENYVDMIATTLWFYSLPLAHALSNLDLYCIILVCTLKYLKLEKCVL